MSRLMYNLLMKKEIDFPLEIDGIKIDDKPRTFYLTIGVILSLNNSSSKVIEIQEEFSKQLNAQSIVGAGIYKYPADTIHFSIINFSGLSSSIENEQEFKEKRKSHINKIKSILSKLDLQKIKKDNKKVDFSYIYTKNIESLTIQAFPSEALCEFFEKNVKKELEKDPDLNPVKVEWSEFKNSKRFRVNIIRFFRKLSNIEYDIVACNVKAINLKCDNDGKKVKNSLFEMELKHISFVFSDNWLSNENPELYSISL